MNKHRNDIDSDAMMDTTEMENTNNIHKEEPLNSPHTRSRLESLSDKLISEINVGKSKLSHKVAEIEQYKFIADSKTNEDIMEHKSVGFVRRENGSKVIRVNGEDIHGEWAPGYFVKIEGDEFIYAGTKNTGLALSDDKGVVYYPETRYKIIPGTRCVMSEFVDSVGHPIKENDIVNMDETNFIVKIYDGCFTFINPEYVRIDNGSILVQSYNTMIGLGETHQWKGHKASNVVVVGNIFENKDMFKHLDAESQYDLSAVYRAFSPAIVKAMPDNIMIKRGGQFRIGKCYGKWITGKLVFGGYQGGEPRWYIFSEANAHLGNREVFADTIRKAIGERDVDGNMIFQKDIIQMPGDSIEGSIVVSEHLNNIDYSRYKIIGNVFEHDKLVKKVYRAKAKAEQRKN